MSWLFPSDEAARARRDRLLAVLFAVLLAFLVARAARQSEGVLVRNQEFGARFLAGQDPYFDPVHARRIHGPYPPTFVWIAAPLAVLPTPLARIAWGLVQAAALVVLAHVLRRWTRAWTPSLAPHFPVFYAAALALASRFVLRDTAGGGANLVHAALALLAIDATARGLQLAAGLPFAFSLVCKPYLAPLALFFAARGRWRTLASTAICAAVLFALPGFRYGFERWTALHVRWESDVVAFVGLDDPADSAAVPEGLPVEDGSGNQSLAAALRRAFGSGALGSTWTAAIAGLFLIAVATNAARRARTGLGAATAALAFLPLCLLVSPVTWKAHHALLVPLFHRLACAAYCARRSRLAWTGLALYYVVCNLLSEEIVGRSGKLALERLSVVAWADLFLFAAAIRLAGADERAPRAPVVHV